MKPIGYKTVCEDSLSELDDMVSKYLKRNWQLHCSPYYVDGSYLQALVWYDTAGKCPHDCDDSEVRME